MKRTLIILLISLFLVGIVFAVEEVRVDLLNERLSNALTELEAGNAKELVVVCNDINMQRIFAEKQYENLYTDVEKNYMPRRSCGCSSPTKEIVKEVIEVPSKSENCDTLIGKYWKKECSNAECNSVDYNDDGIIDLNDLISCAEKS